MGYEEKEKLYAELGMFVYASIILNFQNGDITNKEWLFDYMLREGKEVIGKLNESKKEV